MDLAGFSLVPSYVLAGIHVTWMMFFICSTILPITGVKYFLKCAFNSVNSSSTLALLHKSINRNVVISIFWTRSQGAKVELKYINEKVCNLKWRQKTNRVILKRLKIGIWCYYLHSRIIITWYWKSPYLRPFFTNLVINRYKYL